MTLPLRADAVDSGVWAELGKVNELAASFTQVQYRTILKQPLTSEGSVRFTRAGSKLAWIVEKPSKTSFTLDGSIVHMDYPELGMSETIDLAQVPDASRLASSMLVWMQADAATVARDFDATYESDGVALAPKDAELRKLVSRIHLTLAEAPVRVRQVDLIEPDGDRVEIRFHDLILDGRPVPDP